MIRLLSGIFKFIINTSLIILAAAVYLPLAVLRLALKEKI